MKQKRVYVRIEDFIEVECSSEESGVVTIFKTKTRDISAGGIRVYLTHKLYPQDEMRLKITLPGYRRYISAEASVVISELIGVVGDKGQDELYETRFKFKKMNAEARTDLIHYIHKCKKKRMDAKIG
ncbi:MAG: PilZ domain-containing protein [PVC group bacterium]|nr:PilZ domain-containing protein [PVC group bacterium]